MYVIKNLLVLSLETYNLKIIRRHFSSAGLRQQSSYYGMDVQRLTWSVKCVFSETGKPTKGDVFFLLLFFGGRVGIHHISG